MKISHSIEMFASSGHTAVSVNSRCYFTSTNTFYLISLSLSLSLSLSVFFAQLQLTEPNTNRSFKINLHPQYPPPSVSAKCMHLGIDVFEYVCVCSMYQGVVPMCVKERERVFDNSLSSYPPIPYMFTANNVKC